MPDKRNDVRGAPLLLCLVSSGEEEIATQCCVLDISLSGARLLVPDDAVVPDVFNLHLPALAKTLRSAVQWRSADEVGIAFV